MKRTRVMMVGLLLGGCLSAGIAFAHSTGHESRTPAQCQLLPGSNTGGERGNCLRCVTRTDGRWHFHPDYPAGNRCRPDNGQP